MINGEKIKSKRGATGFSRRVLGEIIGYSKETIERAENRNKGSVEFIYKLAKYFKIDPSEIDDRFDEPPIITKEFTMPNANDDIEINTIRGRISILLDHLNHDDLKSICSYLEGYCTASSSSRKKNNAG